VRNKAVQHRAENGYTGGRSIVLPGHFALCHASEPPAGELVEAAFRQFGHMEERYGAWEVAPVRSREAITYLDLASHELFDVAPDDYDACRRVVARTRAFDLVVSAPLMENADASLARLLRMAPSTGR
jgi:hypothetical protein